MAAFKFPKSSCIWRSSSLKNQPTGKIFWWRDCVLHVGVMTQNTLHHHHAVQLCVGLDCDVTYRTTSGGEWQQQRSLAVPPDVPHQLALDGSRVASFFIDPDHRGFGVSELSPTVPDIFRELVSPVRSALMAVEPFRGWSCGRLEVRSVVAAADTRVPRSASRPCGCGHTID